MKWCSLIFVSLFIDYSRAAATEPYPPIYYYTPERWAAQRPNSIGSHFYQCETGLGSGCQWTNYTRNEDWGFYSKTMDDCTWCQEKCSDDLNCGAVECGLGYCSWWKWGKCTYKEAARDEYYNPNFKTCRRSLVTVPKPAKVTSKGVCNYKCWSRGCQHEYRSPNGAASMKGKCVVKGIIGLVFGIPKCYDVHPQCSKCADKCKGLEGQSFSEIVP